MLRKRGAERRLTALPDSEHRLHIPGIFLVLPEGDDQEGSDGATAVAEGLTGSGLVAGAQGRFVLIPGVSPAEMEEVLKTAGAVLTKRRAPSLVLGMFGDLATWDVASAHLPPQAAAQVAEVVAEIDRIRRMVAG